MSYSRWGTSCWYTYSDVTLKNGEPALTVQCDASFSLSELLSNKEGVLQKFREERFERNPSNYQGGGPAPKDRYTEEEIQELSQIIDWFIEDETRDMGGSDDEPSS